MERTAVPRRDEPSTLSRESTYDRWLREQGIPDVRGLSIDDLNQVPLAPWERMGGLGTFVHLEGSADAVNDGYVCDIPAGGQLKPQKHLFEEMVHVVGGRRGGRGALT